MKRWPEEVILFRDPRDGCIEVCRCDRRSVKHAQEHVYVLQPLAPKRRKANKKRR